MAYRSIQKILNNLLDNFLSRQKKELRKKKTQLKSEQ